MQQNPQPEKPYVYEEYPKYMYHPEYPKGQLVHDAEQAETAVEAGWFDTPAAFGVVTAPSVEENSIDVFAKTLADKKAKDKKAEDAPKPTRTAPLPTIEIADKEEGLHPKAK